MVRLACSAAALAAAFGLSANVAAMPLPLSAALVTPEAAGCGPTFASAAPPALVPMQTKAEALLGGKMSALERIRAAQGASSNPILSSTGTTALAQVPVLAPAAAGFSNPAQFVCGTGIGPTFSSKSLLPRQLLQPILTSPALLPGMTPIAILSPSKIAPNPFTASVRPQAVTSDLILGSRRIPIGKTQFDRSWARVESETLGNVSRLGLPAMSRGNADADRLANVRAINAWVNHHIRYVEDSQLYGKADYWAGARETLKLREGDCEDIAIAKMQLLAKMGISRDDMILTIARDNVRHADHALLMVEVDGRRVMLDNATDTLLDASQPQDYRPILSFGSKGAWLHGY
ncbi:transglutaminase-like cysteine peptidase [Tsuneonella mangrovi]|uniref:transglutaminase-like cysteine peptidase n=1 Tax=Tsuneonella mangrovi TaxID=1982042 RepID=UPI001470F7CF|nr:transglutaminase-like cysteine peptidase [Tsuneonella mangrovi]